MSCPTDAQAGVIRSDFHAIVGESHPTNGELSSDQIRALLAANLSREPNAAEVDLVTAEFRGRTMTADSWIKWIYSSGPPAMERTLSLAKITGKKHESSATRAIKLAHVAFSTEFSGLDKDGDGSISRDEWKARFGSEDGFDVYDQDHDGIVTKEEYKRAKESEALANLVKVALGGAWADTPIAKIEVKNTSGMGGSATYRVSAPHQTVALHSRSETSVADLLFEQRMKAASKLFAAHNLGPARLAEGVDWYIEPWQGQGEPKFDSVGKFEQLGRLMGQVHMMPTDWFDEWRAKICEANPDLKVVDKGSWLWILASRPAEEQKWDKINPEARELLLQDYFYAPQSEPGKRIVTLHGDAHQKNMLQLDDSMICIDLETSCVGHAIHDLGYQLTWIEENWFGVRIRVLRSYLISFHCF